MTDQPEDIDLAEDLATLRQAHGEALLRIEALEAFRAGMLEFRTHVDEALFRLSSLPARLAEVEGGKLCASAAAQAFNTLDVAHQEAIASVHGRLDTVEPVLATLAPEALPEIAAQVAAAAEPAPDADPA